MLVLIWFVVGLLLGLFVSRRSVALSRSAVLWAITSATIAAGGGYRLDFGADSVGIFATLAIAVLGSWLGALVRRHRLADARNAI
jgi:hypothetical protein